jgi:hypothetical protein
MFIKILVSTIIITTVWMIYEIINAPEVDENERIINKNKK